MQYQKAKRGKSGDHERSLHLNIQAVTKVFLEQKSYIIMIKGLLRFGNPEIGNYIMTVTFGGN